MTSWQMRPVDGAAVFSWVKRPPNPLKHLNFLRKLDLQKAPEGRCSTGKTGLASPRCRIRRGTARRRALQIF